LGLCQIQRLGGSTTNSSKAGRGASTSTTSTALKSLTTVSATNLLQLSYLLRRQDSVYRQTEIAPTLLNVISKIGLTLLSFSNSPHVQTLSSPLTTQLLTGTAKFGLNVRQIFPHLPSQNSNLSLLSVRQLQSTKDTLTKASTTISSRATATDATLSQSFRSSKNHQSCCQQTNNYVTPS
jgi:hypothetical protein